jgi:hypothetical protein
MDALTTKAQLLETIEAEHTAWLALLDTIGADRMLLPGAAGPDWTFKDVVAHLTAWRRRTIDRLQAGLRHTDPAPPPWPAEFDEEDDAGLEQINAWFYNADRDRPLAAVLRESEAAWQQMADLVRAMPEEDLLDPQRFAWTDGVPLGPTVLNGSFEHLHEEHMPAIQDWLEKLNAESRLPSGASHPLRSSPRRREEQD